TTTPSGRASVSYGNYNTVTTKGYASTGVAPGVAGDIALTYTRQGDGYGRNLATGADVNKTDLDLGLRTKWLIEPIDGTTITLIGDYAKMRGDRGVEVRAVRRSAFGPGLPPGANPQDTISDLSPVIETISSGGSGRLDQDLGAVKLVS